MSSTPSSASTMDSLLTLSTPLTWTTQTPSPATESLLEQLMMVLECRKQILRVRVSLTDFILLQSVLLLKVLHQLQHLPPGGPLQPPVSLSLHSPSSNSWKTTSSHLPVLETDPGPRHPQDQLEVVLCTGT